MQPQTLSKPLSVDLSRIENAEVRRAIRQLVQQLQETILHQQIQIEALLELITERNVASLSEFRRAVNQVTARASERTGRIHEHVSQAVSPASLQANAREAEPVEEPTRRVYKL